MIPALLLLFAPAVAEQPQQSAWFVRVDFVVVNYHRTVTENTEVDPWGRIKPRWTATETVWISYWNETLLPTWPARVVRVGRGWDTADRVRIVPCTAGWACERSDGITVVAAELRIVTSPYDWELRNRRIHAPLKKP